MPLITVTQGAREGAFKGEDGVHAATLVAIEGPRSGVNKQTGEAYEAMDWVFAVDDAPDDASLVWASTSVASGPRSKMFGFLTALLGGKAPAVGQGFEAADLVGRQALLTIRRDEEGWTRVENVGALPRQMQAAPTAPAPAPAPAPRPAPRVVNGTRPTNGTRPQTLREQVEQPSADAQLPF